jgi:hypothetical protein
MFRNPLVLGAIIAVAAIVSLGRSTEKPKPQEFVPPAPVYTELDWKYLPQAKGICELAPEYREKNYAGGSCGHASTESALRWPGSIDPVLMQAAAEWRRKYHGGLNDSNHEKQLKASGLKYVMTTDGDLEFMEWLVVTRRMAWIAYKPKHMINFCGRFESDGKQWAVLLDNNHTKNFEYVEWNIFIKKWKGYGGWAGTVVYDPPPPVPTT